MQKLINSTNQDHFEEARFVKVFKDLRSVYKLKPLECAVYSEMFDVLSLSIKNKDQYSDEKGIFVRYEQTKLANEINVSRETVGNAIERLREKGLIFTDLVKKGLSNKIYFTAFDLVDRIKPKDKVQEAPSIPVAPLTPIGLGLDLTPPNTQLSTCGEIGQPACGDFPLPDTTCGNFTQPTCGNFPQELDLNLLDPLLKTINQSISFMFGELNTRIDTLSQEIKQKKSEDGLIDGSVSMDGFEIVESHYKDLINYDSLVNYYSRADRECVGVVDDVLTAVCQMHYQDELKVGEDMHKNVMVRGVLSKITNEHVERIISDFKGYRKNVKNSIGFLKSMIFNQCSSHSSSIVNTLVVEDEQDRQMQSGDFYLPPVHDPVTQQDISPAPSGFADQMNSIYKMIG